MADPKLAAALSIAAKREKEAEAREEKLAEGVYVQPGKIRVRLIRPMTTNKGKYISAGIVDLDDGTQPKSAKVIKRGPKAEEAKAADE